MGADERAKHLDGGGFIRRRVAHQALQGVDTSQADGELVLALLTELVDGSGEPIRDLPLHREVLLVAIELVGDDQAYCDQDQRREAAELRDELNGAPERCPGPDVPRAPGRRQFRWSPRAVGVRATEVGLPRGAARPARDHHPVSAKIPHEPSRTGCRCIPAPLREKQAHEVAIGEADHVLIVDETEEQFPEADLTAFRIHEVWPAPRGVTPPGKLSLHAPGRLRNHDLRPCG